MYKLPIFIEMCVYFDTFCAYYTKHRQNDTQKQAKPSLGEGEDISHKWHNGGYLPHNALWGDKATIYRLVCIALGNKEIPPLFYNTMGNKGRKDAIFGCKRNNISRSVLRLFGVYQQTSGPNSWDHRV